MNLGEWDSLAPVAAVIALGILVLVPDHPRPPGADPDDRLGALESASAGEGVPWSDPASGQRGLLVPAGIFQGGDGLWCRRYQLTFDAVDMSAAVSHVACRSRDGDWRERIDSADRSGRPLHKGVEGGEQSAAMPN